MEQDSIHILKEKIKEHTAYRDYAEFKRKRSLYQDHFLDAEKHEAERDEEQAIIDRLRAEIQAFQNEENTRQSSLFIECMDCGDKVHQNRIRTHKCKNTPVTRRKLKLA